MEEFKQSTSSDTIHTVRGTTGRRIKSCHCKKSRNRLRVGSGFFLFYVLLFAEYFLNAI